MEFSCDFCDGTVRDGLTRRDYVWGDRHIATFDNVPCGICDRCGERYFDSDVVHEMDLLAQPLVLKTGDMCMRESPVIDFTAHRHKIAATTTSRSQ